MKWHPCIVLAKWFTHPWLWYVDGSNVRLYMQAHMVMRRWPYFAQWNNKTRKIFCMALTLQWWQIRLWQLYALFHMCINKTANRLSRKQVNEWRKKSDHFNRFQIALTLEACEHHKKVFPDKNSYNFFSTNKWFFDQRLADELIKCYMQQSMP